MDRLISERMFVTVLETGSFAAAAQRLGTSSGQASKLVSKLEAELGVRLLHRTTRALAATEAGQAYFDRLRSLLDEFDALDTETRNAALLPRGKIRLSAPLSFGTIRLPPALPILPKPIPRLRWMCISQTAL
ncbi:LysR family transcriptional regulator [Cypionkella psychrotolerans]|uniref:LysR family transcriptional regulator n=1 Tax=Cypionkella psychrotolerans TaxID=1678131 RepID=UPI000AABA331|nr:LysR family transcriptional regulator [Cypionkella psychrotolerans]